MSHRRQRGDRRGGRAGLRVATGGHSPAWLRFVSRARTVGTVLGCALIVVGFLHYRNIELRGEVHWIVLGLLILAGAGAVHSWMVRTQRG